MFKLHTATGNRSIDTMSFPDLETPRRMAHHLHRWVRVARRACQLVATTSVEDALVHARAVAIKLPFNRSLRSCLVRVVHARKLGLAHVAHTNEMRIA